MRIAIAGDHAGFAYKKRLVSFLKDNGHEDSDLWQCQWCSHDSQ